MRTARSMLRGALVPLLALVAMMAFCSTAAASSRSWVLANDFRTHPDAENPNPDSYGNKPWLFLKTSSLTRPILPELMLDFASDLCGSEGVEAWHGDESGPFPFVGINATSGVGAPCGTPSWPPGQISVHPGFGQLAVVGWQSPIDGTVSISGGVTDLDANGGDGIRWFIDRGPANLASGGIANGDNQVFASGTGGADLSSVPVQNGEVLYFIVDPRGPSSDPNAIAGDRNFDTTGLSVTITEVPAAGAFSRTLNLWGDTNIFGAGHTVAPSAGGGAGELPPGLSFTAKAGRVLTVSNVSGTVNSGCTSSLNGPDGLHGECGGTDINSTGGIAGIVDSQANMMLVGIFLADSEPQDPAPARLDFSPSAGLGEDYATIAPGIGQVFYVGDGLTGTGSGSTQQIQVPANATRVFLGFADAFIGDTGWYGDNSGAFEATVNISAGDAPTSPPTVATNAATGVTSTAAMLRGQLNPNGQNLTSCRFQYKKQGEQLYGPEQKCDQTPSSIGSGTSGVPVSGTIADGTLSPGTTYVFRLTAANASGAGFGDPLTFTTSAAPTPAPPPSPSPGGTGTATPPSGPVLNLSKSIQMPDLRCEDVDLSRELLAANAYVEVKDVKGVPKRKIPSNLKCPGKNENLKPNDVVAQSPAPGQQLNTTPGHPAPVTLTYYEPSLDCQDYYKLGDRVTSVLRPLYYEAADELENEGCRYRVAFSPTDLFAEPRIRSGTVKDKVIYLKVWWPKDADLSLVGLEGTHQVSPTADLSFLATNAKSGWHLLATDDARNNSSFSIQVIEQRTRALVTNAVLELIDSSGKLVETRKTGPNGANNKVVGLSDPDGTAAVFRGRFKPGRYTVRAHVGDENSLTEDGYAYIQVDKPDTSSGVVTMSGEKFVWKRGAVGTWVRAAKSADVRGRAAATSWFSGLIDWINSSFHVSISGGSTAGSSEPTVSLPALLGGEKRVYSNSAKTAAPCQISSGQTLQGSSDPTAQGGALTLAPALLLNGNGVVTAGPAPAIPGDRQVGCATQVTDLNSTNVASSNYGVSDKVSGDGNVIAVGGGNYSVNGHKLTYVGGNLLDATTGQVIAVGAGNFTFKGDDGRDYVIAVGGGNARVVGYLNPATGNVIAVGGGNVIAVGAGNVIAVGGGNMVNSAGQVIAVGGGNVIAVGAGNVIAVGGGNVIAVGGGNLTAKDIAGNLARTNGVIAVGGGNLKLLGDLSPGNVIAVGSGNLTTYLESSRLTTVGLNSADIYVAPNQVIAVGAGH
jgi:hypothetical protein